MLYTQDEIKKANRTLGIFIATYVFIALGLVGLVVYACVARLPYVLYGAAALLGASSVFLWDIFGARIITWKRFLYSMLNDRRHDFSGVIKLIEPQASEKSGMEFLRVHIMDTAGQGGDEPARVFYYDVTRPALTVKEGDTVHIEYTDRYINQMKI